MINKPTIGIMQPYLFPYIGYFQLINAVDVFVFYNDVNYIKRGWINRNRILVNNKEYLFTVPIENASQNKRICDSRILQNDLTYSKVLSIIESSYKKAPYFSEVMPLIHATFNPMPEYIDQLAEKSIRVFCEYLGLSTQLKESRMMYNNEHLKKADRLIDICQKEHSDTYINAAGGIELYSKEYFLNSDVSISFLRTNSIRYAQYGDDFVENLSIIDVAMFNDKSKIQVMLKDYKLL